MFEIVSEGAFDPGVKAREVIAGPDRLLLLRIPAEFLIVMDFEEPVG